MAFKKLCPKGCGKKIIWSGPLETFPPCPECGYQIPLLELKRRQNERVLYKNFLLLVRIVLNGLRAKGMKIKRSDIL